MANTTEHLITLEGSSAKTPKSVCTCGWEFGPSEKLLDLGLQAMNHSAETGHAMRQHTFGMSD